MFVIFDYTELMCSLYIPENVLMHLIYFQKLHGCFYAYIHTELPNPPYNNSLP